ncbi:MAG: FIST C-terminal domain-containing protein [bacterium]
MLGVECIVWMGRLLLEVIHMFFPELTALTATLRQGPPGKDEALAILVGEESVSEVDDLIDALNWEGIRFFGGVFPGLIWGDTIKKTGYIVKRVPAFHRLYITHDLNSAKGLAALGEGQRCRSAMILVDGTAPGICSFLADLFSLCGDANYMGGGVGFSDFEPDNCLFSNEGFFGGGAVVAFFDYPLSLAVKHGWRKCKGPFIVTKSAGNVIEEINWEEAFPFYQRVLRYSGEEITPENFFAVAKKYPLGLYKRGHEDIVRDPFKTDGSRIFCVGEVPENALFYILEGSKEGLISSARQVARNCVKGMKTPTGCLVFNCISRAQYLEDAFREELGAISEALANLTVEGALTLGEISSSGYGGISFLNKTVVVGVV